MYVCLNGGMCLDFQLAVNVSRQGELESVSECARDNLHKNG